MLVLIQSEIGLTCFQMKWKAISISETKTDGSFLTSPFEIDGFNIPFQVDWDQKIGWLMLYIRKDIPA